MFYSIDLLTLKPDLAVVWLAGTMGSHRQLKGISKQEVIRVNLITACELISQPSVPMSIRFTASLLLGIVRVQFRKTEFLLGDVTQAYQTIVKSITSITETELKSHQLLAPLHAITLPDRPAFEIWVELVNDTIPPIQPLPSNLDWSIIGPEPTISEYDISIPRDESREAFREFTRESPSQLFPLDDFRGEVGTSFDFDDLEPIPEISRLPGVEMEPTLPPELQFASRQLTPLLERPSLEQTIIEPIIRPYKRPRFDKVTELSLDEMDPNRPNLFEEFYDQWSQEHTKKLARLQYKEVFDTMFVNPGSIGFIPNLQSLWETTFASLITEPQPTTTDYPTMEEELPRMSPPPLELIPELPPELMLPWETSPIEPILSSHPTPSSGSDRDAISPITPRISRGLPPKQKFLQFLLQQPRTSTEPLMFHGVLGSDQPTRHTVCTAFLLLLGLESDHQLTTHQPQPYDTITIYPITE